MKTISTITLLFILAACSGGKDKYDATGTFETTEVVVSAEASGKLLYMNVEEGMKLQVGQTVGMVDTVQLYLKKLQLEANARSVKGQRPDIRKQIAATQEQIKQAERERDRIKRLLDADAANRKQLDDAESMLQVLRKQLVAQNSTLQNSDQSLSWQSSSVDIQVAQVNDQLTKCRVCAPIEGTVLAQYAEAGEFVAPGTPLFRLGNMEQMYLRAYITSEQLADVRLGQIVKVVADYGGGQQREYEGSVTWIADTSEFTPKNILTKDERANLVYAVKVAVRNDGMLKIGMYGGIVLP
ncbi:HlyD family secretion protein [Mediterranea massiliensis]|uniref:HlyD family secretion protein n=1 Tax=Mediterranea massiliensis TaxID=1841865 RepID=UPI0025A3799A|nr:HlyD family efflux transporter periplasmic adaptor subunit [Mediterranea massiliensis]MDM8338636.1 HlyD family efflux transporter periplasmic adaptor subunit [Mediterranea massiliensis]